MKCFPPSCVLQVLIQSTGVVPFVVQQNLISLLKLFTLKDCPELLCHMLQSLVEVARVEAEMCDKTFLQINRLKNYVIGQLFISSPNSHMMFFYKNKTKK